MARQPESSMSYRIAQAFRKRGGFVFKVHGSSLMMRGLPDLVGSYRGLFVSLETKLGDNTPSPVQRLRHKQIRKSEGIVAVVRNVPQAMRILDQIDAALDG